MAQRLALKRVVEQPERVLSLFTKSPLTPAAFFQSTTDVCRIYRPNSAFNSIPKFNLRSNSRRYLSDNTIRESANKKLEEEEIPNRQNSHPHENPSKSEKSKAGETIPDPEFVPPFAPPHIHDLVEELVNMSMFDAKELSFLVADHFGLPKGGNMNVAATDAPGGETAASANEVKEEKTVFDLNLVGFDAKAKIKVIKEVRAITSLGLKEAKEMVESAPKVMKKGIKRDEAEALKAKLEAVGATVEIV